MLGFKRCNLVMSLVVPWYAQSYCTELRSTETGIVGLRRWFRRSRRFIRSRLMIRQPRSNARIRHDLEVAGTTIGPYDLQIAAICLVHGLTLE